MILIWELTRWCIYIYISLSLSSIVYYVCVCQPRGVATGRNNAMNEVRQNVAILFVRSLHCFEWSCGLMWYTQQSTYPSSICLRMVFYPFVIVLGWFIIEFTVLLLFVFNPRLWFDILTCHNNLQGWNHMIFKEPESHPEWSCRVITSLTDSHPDLSENRVYSQL